MVGKHINASARNKTIFMKCFRVFLAVVLLGLMVPHGISTSLNAYAGNAEDQVTENSVVTEETPSLEEVTPVDPVPVVSIADNGETDIHFTAELTFTDGVFLDDTASAGTSSLPEHWSVLETADNKITKIKREETIAAGSEEPTIGDIIDELNIYRSPNGGSKDLIKGLPEGCNLEDFYYPANPTGSSLDTKVTNGSNYVFKAVINTSIIINPGIKDGVQPASPKLMYWAQEGAHAAYDGWPTNKSIKSLQLGSTWTIEDNLLKVSGSSLFGDHALYEFKGTIECTNFDFNGFQGPQSATTGTIAYNTEFTGKWKNKPVNVKLLSDWTDGLLPAGVTLWKSDNGAQASQVTTFPFTEALDPELEYKAITWAGYQVALQIGDVKYGFKLTADAALKYNLTKWQYSKNEDKSYTDVDTTAAEIGQDPLFFRVGVEEIPSVTFATNLGESFPKGSEIQLFKQVGEGSITQAQLSDVLYFGSGAKFVLAKPPEGQGYEAFTVKINDTNYFFKVNIPANASANYKLAKWTYDMGDTTGGDVPSNLTDITDDLTLNAVFDIKVSFAVSPVKTPAWGKVVDSGQKDVTEAYARPGNTLTLNDSKITINQNQFEALANDGYEWVSWSTTPASLTAVPKTPFSLTANFNQTPIIKFAVEDVNGQVDVSDYVKVCDPDGNPIPDLAQYTVPDIAVGSTYKVDSSKPTNLIIDGKTYTLQIDSHYVSLATSIWYLDKGTQADTPVGTTPVSLADGENITLVAKAKYEATLTASGKIVCDKPQNATVRVDVVVDAGQATEKIVDTQFPSVNNSGSYTVSNLPLNVMIFIYVDNAGYNYAYDKAQVNTQSITLNNITLTKDYSFSYGKLVNKVWSSDSNSKKTLTASAQPTGTDYYTFAEGSTLKLNACKATDTISFVNLKGRAGNDETKIKVGDNTVVLNNRGVTYEIKTADINDGVVTITFLDDIDLDFVAVHAVDRVVKFSVNKAEGSDASGTFVTAHGSITSLTVGGLGVTFSANAAVLTFTDTEGTAVTATADSKSIFRKWNITGTQDVLEDMVVTATFVQQTIKINFVADSGSQTADLPADLIVKMDSIFTQSSTKLDASAIFTKDQVADAKTISIKTADKIKYKFANPAFIDAPTAGTKINEEYQADIEKSGLTLTYKTVVRDRFVVTIDLNKGHLVSPYTIPTVDSSLGGDGNWIADSAQTKYTNHFYEDYPYQTTDGVKGILTWLTNDKSNIDRYDGFFKGTWTGPDSGALTANTTWTADFAMAHHILGTVTEKVSSTAIAAMDITATSNRAVPISPAGTQVKVTTAADGKYDLKLYEGAQCTVQAGDKTHIEQSKVVSLGASDIDVPFVLEKGYTFIPKDFDDDNMIWKSMFEAGKSITDITDAEKAANSVNFDKNGTFTYASSNVLQPGDTFVISVSGAATSVTINNGFDETVEVKDGKIEYRVWNVNSNVTITASDEALSISRIEYHVVEAGSVITYAGAVKDINTTQPIEGVDVKFVSAVLNETVETKTNDKGEYYLLLSSPATGVITYVDGNYLDEKLELNNVTSSKMDANEDLVEAIHVTGVVYYKDFYTQEVKVAKGVTVRYTANQADPYNPWTEDYHGEVTTGDDGSYILKLRKTNSVSGGVVWFNWTGYAQGKYILEDASLNPLPHTNDISGIGDTLVTAGASVKVSGDVAKGHKIFNVKNFLYGYKIADFETVDSEGMQFAAAGEFYAGYDEVGNHILKYVYNPDKLEPAEYVITMTAIAQDNHTFWAWRCDNPVTGKKTTLFDNQTIALEYPTASPYVFTADYAESTDIKVGANPSEGHGGWSLVYKINGVEEGSYVLAPEKDLNFSFPNSKAKDPSNDASEPIESSYSYDGTSFIITLNSEFEKAAGGTQLYNEVRIFTPIPADGYQFEGISLNNVDMAVGYTETIDSETPALNVLAKYSLIPQPNVQTGDSNNYWWLFAVVTIALACVAYAGTRRQKGIRR